MDEENSSSMEQSRPEHHIKFLNETKSLTRVDPKYQAVIPEAGTAELNTQCIKLHDGVRLQAGSFKAELEDYLLFASHLMQWEGKPVGTELQLQQTDFKRGSHKRTIYSSDGLIIAGASTCAQEVHEKALEFLARQQYNFIKAKFYLLFPTLLVHNRFLVPIEPSEEQMQQCIENHISRLNEDKASLELKWKAELQEMITRQPKVHLAQLQSYIEQGQQLKYEVPEQIRQIVQSAVAASKSLTKVIRNQEKLTIEQLRATLHNAEENLPVVTHELAQLKEVIVKVNQWMAKWPEVTPSQKVPYKTLRNNVLEYKSLPIQSDSFENNQKRLFEMAKDLVDRLGKTTKAAPSKTRSQIQIVCQVEKTERLTLQQAREIVQQINSISVTCEEYDGFVDQFEEASEVYERCCMYLEDDRREGVAQQVQGLLKEVVDCAFQFDVQDRLQDLSDYVGAFEKIKRTLTLNKVDAAYKEIQDAKERGFHTQELVQLELVLQQVLDWNTRSNQYLNSSESIDLVSVYEEDFSEGSNLVARLLPVNPEILHFIDKAKVLELQDIQQREQHWNHQLRQLLEPRISTRKDHLKQRNVQGLWDLIKEGLRYYRHEVQLLKRAIETFNLILEWIARVYYISQSLGRPLGQELITEGVESLVDTIGQGCIGRVIHHNYEDLRQRSTLESLHKLYRTSLPFVQGTAEMNILERLIAMTERWNREAESIILQQTPFSAETPSSVIQYESNICNLLHESKYLPINNHLVTQLNGIYEANKKATHILSIINQREQALERLLELAHGQAVTLMQADLARAAASTFTPTKRKAGQQPTVSAVAKRFFQDHLHTLMPLFDELARIDSARLKKVAYSHIKLNKLKDISQEFSLNCQNCPTILKEGFQTVRLQLQQTLTSYDQWLVKVQALLQPLEVPKRKKNPRKRTEESESQQELSDTTPQMRTELIFYFKVPQLILLFVEAAQQSYFCPEMFESWRFLEEVYQQIREAQTIIQSDQRTKSPKDLSTISKSNVYMPQFHVLGKLQRLSQNWTVTAQYIVNQTPRAKNLFVKSKMSEFIDKLNAVAEHESSEPMETEGEPVVQTPPSQLKPKREKRLSKLMLDESMAFYDPNASLKKAFGEKSPKPKLDLKRKIKKPPHKRPKLDGRRALMQQKIKRRARQIDTPQEIEQHNQQFLLSFRENSQELQALYIYDKPYCICRQGSESQITDWNILKCMVEHKVSEFFLLHLKQQESKKIMVCCDMCNEWYHQECMGIKTHQMKQNDKYVCRVCVLKSNPIFLIGQWETLNSLEPRRQPDNGKPTRETNEFLALQAVNQKQTQQIEELLANSGDIYSNRYQKTSFANFRDFVELGRNLPLYLIELEAIELIYERIVKWLDRSRQLIQTYNLQQPHQEYELALHLFSESIWFPVALEESDRLLLIIHQIDFVRKAHEVQQGKRSFLGKGKIIKKSLVDRTINLHEYLTRQAEIQIDPNDIFIMGIVDTLKLQQNLNSSLEKQIQMLTQSNPKIEDYEELCRQFDSKIKSHQRLTPFEVTKHIELKEKISQAKGLMEWQKQYHPYLELGNRHNTDSNEK